MNSGIFFLHQMPQQVVTVTEAADGNWSKLNIEEYEANLFGSELLMPPSLSSNTSLPYEPSFANVRRLARKIPNHTYRHGGGSIPHDKEDCALVSCEGRPESGLFVRTRFPIFKGGPLFMDIAVRQGESGPNRTGPFKSNLEAGMVGSKASIMNHQSPHNEEARDFPRMVGLSLLLAS